ncbi:ECF transporter S component [Gleimia hominis]|uniref:ECF transporter S component n=1 Tax=Gleimia hominis TaxID=595468 RepID=A0ABU3I9L8_9ACTO|nr:ECF transporter S component [Gleimia hominis]MDT3767072.1 ECF transporter S component [Gleimia hominis]WIK64518.1 ECF transporter S component [Gleimia hominis]
MSNQEDLTKPVSSQGWRVVDIVVAAILGIATGLIFFAWNSVGYAWYKSMDAVTPGFGGIATGIWFLGAPLGALIIRKPGAGIFVEVLAACVSALLGNVWGITTLYSGLAQGIAGEIPFLATRYRKFSLPIALASGALSGAGGWFLELFMSPNLPKGLAYNSIYLVTLCISGLFLAGLLGYLLVAALRKTGALAAFNSGRQS